MILSNKFFLPESKEEIKIRLKKPFSKWEIAAGFLSLLIVCGFMFFRIPSLFYDLINYTNASIGDTSFFFYAYWILPFYRLLSFLPDPALPVIYSTISIICILFACRIFNTSIPLILLSYQMLYHLFYGQYVAIVCAALALLWWQILKKNWLIGGVAILLATAKFQTGLIPCVLFLLLSDLKWNEKIKFLIIPVIGFVISLLIYPNWIINLFGTIIHNSPNADASIAPWQWIGYWALLFWIPPILLPMSKMQRIVLILITIPLGVPYFQQCDLLMLFTLIPGFTVVLGYFGYLLPIIGISAIKLMILIPLILYLAIMFFVLQNTFVESKGLKRPIIE